MAGAMECWSGRPSADEEMGERMLTNNHDRSDPGIFRRSSATSSSTPSPVSSPSHPKHTRMWGNRLCRNFAGALAAIKSSLSFDTTRSNERVLFGNFLRNFTQLYPGSQLPEHLINNFRSHFDSLPYSYAQAAFDLKDVLLHVRLIEQASSEENPSFHIEESPEERVEGERSTTVFNLTFASFSPLSWPVISSGLSSFSICCKRIQIFEKKCLTLGVATLLAHSGIDRQFRARVELALRYGVKKPPLSGAADAAAAVKIPFGLCGCQDESPRNAEDYSSSFDDDESETHDRQIELIPNPLPVSSLVVAVDAWQAIHSGGDEVRQWLLSSDEVDLPANERRGSTSFPGTFRGRKVWIKKVKGCERGTPFELELRRHSLQLMTSGHRNILQFVGFLLHDDLGFCVVTKMMERGSLSDLIETTKKIGANEAARIALDVAKGLMFMNDHGVAYRDLNTRRIFLDRKGNACLEETVVGSSIKTSGDSIQYETTGFRWLAPEILSGDPESVRETWMSNVYSFGIVVWEILTGERPFSTCSPVQAAVGIAACGLRPDIPKECPAFLSSLMIKCWNNSPSKRPKLSEIVSVLLDHSNKP